MSIVIPGRAGVWVGNAVGFFTGPWGKLALYGLLVLGGLWGFRMWLNRHDDKVAAETTKKVISKLEVQYVGQWQKELTDARNLYDEGKAALDAASELNRRVDMKFATIFTSLTQIRKAVEDRKVIYVKEAAAIPPAELDDALRILSNHIAAQAPHR